MVGWMDDVALHRTLTTGRSTFCSRSRGEYWVKGETSGHRQWVREVRLDCDGDTVLVKVDQEGAACHTGDRSCFDRRQRPAGRGSASPRKLLAMSESDISPSLEEFRKLAVERRVIPVNRRLLADAETAIGLYRKLARNRPAPSCWSRPSRVSGRATPSSGCAPLRR